MADISSVVASAVEAAEAADAAPVEESAEVVADDTPAESEAADPAPVEAAVADDAAPAAEGTVEKPKRRNPIPLERHEAILTKARAEAEAKFKDVNDKLQRLSWADSPQTAEKMRVLQFAEQNPEGFARALLQDPTFAPMFQRLMQPRPQAAAQTPKASDRPQPDVLLQDGNVGYSPEQHQKLLEWHATQVRQDVLKQMDERFGKVEPLIKQYESNAAFNQAIERQRHVLNEAETTWPMFKEHREDIRKVMLQPGNERMTLDAAYRAVVIPKLQADRDSVRAKALEELNAKTAAAIKPATAAAAVKTGPRSITDIVADAVKRAGQ